MSSASRFAISFPLASFQATLSARARPSLGLRRVSHLDHDLEPKPFAESLETFAVVRERLASPVSEAVHFVTILLIPVYAFLGKIGSNFARALFGVVTHAMDDIPEPQELAQSPVRIGLHVPFKQGEVPKEPGAAGEKKPRQPSAGK